LTERDARPVLLIVLNSLVSEGTPRMALDMCRYWIDVGIAPVLLVLDRSHNELGERFEELGVPIDFAQIAPGRFRRFFDILTQTFSCVRRHRAEGVLSMLFGWHAFIAMGARLAGAGSVVAHVGNHPASVPPRIRKAMRIMTFLGLPFTRTLVCCGEYVRHGIIDELGVPRSHTEVVYNGAAIETVEAEANEASGTRLSGFGDDRLKLVMTARYERHKDQRTAIAAVGELKRRGIESHLSLVGDGTRRREFEDLIESSDLSEQIALTGFRDDVPSVLGRSDIFLFATTPDEGLGIALIEAMAAGVPIVASDVGACRETLADGECGLLVTPNDPGALADGIMALHKDPALRSRLVRNAKSRARTVFSSRAMADAYRTLLTRT
tara:strand:+ start:1338 stop:2480 length:1143 start_codon:yes stop_codon:yes gene_type:complete